MTKALAANATKFQRGTGTPLTYSDIAEVTDLKGPGMKVDAIEATGYDSDGAKEYIGGLLDGGEVSLELNFVPTDTGHVALRTAFMAKNVGDYQIVFPDTPSTKWSFQALITGFELATPVDDKVTATVTLQITGTPTLA